MYQVIYILLNTLPGKRASDTTDIVTTRTEDKY